VEGVVAAQVGVSHLTRWARLFVYNRSVMVNRIVVAHAVQIEGGICLEVSQLELKQVGATLVACREMIAHEWVDCPL
jgi:hypothetical protein